MENETKLTKDAAAFSELVELLKKSYATRADWGATLERRIAGLNPETMLITGEVADRLIFTKPYMFPKKVWGGGIGFRSLRRMNRLLELLGMAPGTFPSGDIFLVRFQIAPQEWIPHPYNVPSWALVSFGAFSSIRNDKFAFSICKQWERENDEAVDGIVKQRLCSFQLQSRAAYNSGFAYADVAILINPPASELLQANTIWQHEAQLAVLVKTLYPDAIRELSPSWLGGQRLDIYVPSKRIAFEYQGEQHYQPIEIYGGAEGLLKRQRQDQRKRELCAANGVMLIEWKYTLPISKGMLLKELARIAPK